MTEQNEISILEISLQPDGLHSFDWTPVYEWYRPNTVRCLWQLVKIPLSGEFFRREKLHLENEISPETNADSHEFYFSCYCIFHIDVEYFLSVFDVSIVCRNKNYRSVLSVRVWVVQTVAAVGHVYAVQWCFAYAETQAANCPFEKCAPPTFRGFFPRWKKYALYTVIYDNINSF